MKPQKYKFDFLDYPYLKVVDFFCNSLFEDVTSKDLNEFFQKNNINHDAFENYFVEPKLAEVKDNKIYLNFQNRFISSLKNARDLYLLQLLPASVRNEIFLAFDHIKSKLKNKLHAVIVIGSAARNKIMPSSDIDLLVITSANKREKLDNYTYKLEVQFYTPQQFHEQFNNNDELILWSIKYGLVLYNNEFIYKYYVPENLFIGESSIVDKRKLIQRLINSLSSSRDMPVNQIESKIERLIFQIARILIILHDEIPLSRWELSSQVKKYSPEIASEINRFYEIDKQSREELLNYFYKIKNIFHEKMRNLNNKEKTHVNT